MESIAIATGPVFDISWPRILLHRTWELSHLRTHHGDFVYHKKNAHEKTIRELGPLPETNMTSHLKIHLPKVKNSSLVGGFNPVEKYARQNGNHPQIGVKIKHIWNHQGVV